MCIYVYMKTFIYAIECKETGETCYIGSCVREYFSQRRCDHTKITEQNKHTYKSVLPVHHYIFDHGGWDNFDFRILYEGEQLGPLDRRQREQEYIDIHKPLHNACRAYTSPDMRKEQRRLQARRFRENNPDYDSRYAEYRKEYGKRRCSTKVACSCGGEYYLNNKTQHLKTKRHQDSLLPTDIDR